MGTENSLFCAGKREIPCAGTGIYWPKNNRKWEWDCTANTRNMGFGQWDIVKIWAGKQK